MTEFNPPCGSGLRGNDACAGHGMARCEVSYAEAAHGRAGDKVACAITVMIVSDRKALLLAWLARLMHEPGIELHAESPTGPARLSDCIERTLPAVLLLDKAMLDRLDGASTQAVRSLFQRTRVLLLSDELCDGLVIDVLRYRFHGFLLNNCPPEAGLQSIRAVSRGELWLSCAALANAIAHLLQASARPAAAEPPQAGRGGSMLTQREQQIAELLRGGYTNKEIANQLGVMEDTVKKHLQSVFRKLGVRRRALVALRPPSVSA